MNDEFEEVENKESQVVMGINSNSIVDDGHLIFLDYDTKDLEYIKKDFERIQKKFNLNQGMLFDSGRGYHIVVPQKVELEILKQVVFSSGADIKFWMFIERNNFATLRVSSKFGAIVSHVGYVGSYFDDANYKDIADKYLMFVKQYGVTDEKKCS